jgi:hypothetical protein
MRVDLIAAKLVAGVLAAVFVTAAPAGTPLSGSNVSITVFADRYVVEGRAFDDLDLLEKHIAVLSARRISLLACGPGEMRSLQAAVHRLRHLPEQIRVLDEDEPACQRIPLATRVRARAGQRPYGIDDEAVDRYWRELMP